MTERFWSKVTKSDHCWEWTAATDGGGYGAYFVRKVDGRTVLARAHRWAYEELVGPIPDGLVLDHLCRNRRCVNPAHLEPVTQGVNIARGEMVARAVEARRAITHCPKGHGYTPENTVHRKSGARTCRECNRLRCEQNNRRRARAKRVATTKPKPQQERNL